MIDTGASPVVEDGGGVVGVGREVDEADDGGDVPAGGGGLDAVQGGEVFVEEGASQDEVFRRVAGEGEFGQDDEIAGGGFGGGDGVQNTLGITRQVADGGVDLGEGDAEAAHGSCRSFVIARGVIAKGGMAQGREV